MRFWAPGAARRRGRIRQRAGSCIPEWAAFWNAIPPVTGIRRTSELPPTTAKTVSADMRSALPIALCLSSKCVRYIGYYACQLSAPVPSQQPNYQNAYRYPDFSIGKNLSSLFNPGSLTM